MPRLGLATLNHSTLHGLPTRWRDHVDAAADAGFDALAPDVFWLRALEEEGLALETLAAALRERDLGCMELAGIAIGDEARTTPELEEQLRYAEALGAEFVNARLVAPPGDAVVAQVARCIEAFQRVGTSVALEFSRGSELKGVADTEALVARLGDPPGVGVTLDTWHFFLHPDGPDWAALEALQPARLANVQLSDGVPYEAGAFGDATMNRRRMPGEGGFDLARFFGVVRGKGVDPAIVVEVLSGAERERSLTDFAARAAETTRAACA